MRDLITIKLTKKLLTAIDITYSVKIPMSIFIFIICPFKSLSLLDRVIKDTKKFGRRLFMCLKIQYIYSEQYKSSFINGKINIYIRSLWQYLNMF